jgi:hypothetical protein
MVGTTAEQLESIKELIQFDHEYIKPVQLDNNKKPANVTKVVNSPTDTIVVKCNKKPQKMVSVINLKANSQVKPVDMNAHSHQTVTPVKQDTGLELPEFFENEDILNFGADLMKDLDIEKLLGGGIIDNVDKQSPPASSVISQDNPRKRKASDITDCIKQTRTDDFCFQTMVKFDDIFSNDETQPESNISEQLRDAGSPASVASLSSSSSIHDDLWEESFSELFPNLV